MLLFSDLYDGDYRVLMSVTQVFDSQVHDEEDTEDPSSGSEDEMLIPKVRQT